MKRLARNPSRCWRVLRISGTAFVGDSGISHDNCHRHSAIITSILTAIVDGSMISYDNSGNPGVVAGPSNGDPTAVTGYIPAMAGNADDRIFTPVGEQRQFLKVYKWSLTFHYPALP